MNQDLATKVKRFSSEVNPTECKCDHQLQGTGAVFFQSVGLIKCTKCNGWQLIRKQVK